jgi:hypothetical protein
MTNINMPREVKGHLLPAVIQSEAGEIGDIWYLPFISPRGWPYFKKYIKDLITITR